MTDETPLDLAALQSMVRDGALDLKGRGLSSLPPEIGQLTNLSVLSLSGNQLSSLPPEIGRLTNLQRLDLNGNQLSSLPPEIGQLTNLPELYLSDNQLSSLPPEIGQLTNLRRLSLSDNQLSSLPVELAPLLAGDLILSGEGNRWSEPYPDLLARGPGALAAYLSSLGDADDLFEAKLLLVGEGNIGKTCLVAALRGEPFVAGRSTTHGIEIRDLVLGHPTADTNVTVRAWDFGGQEVYRITHQFFFTPRAVYLVVWKPREGQEENAVEGWLRRIRLRVAEGATALIVATHCDERRPELAYTQLRKAFPNLLVGHHTVDNHSGHGIAELRGRISELVAGLPQMGQRLSRRWLAVRDEILDRAPHTPQIPYQEYLNACITHQVTDPDEVRTLLELMHDLGQVIYYGDDEGLKDIVVLNPDWLTKAISYVLEDQPTRDAGGVLDHARLRTIWSQPTDGAGYPREHHPYFLRLMEKFDVSYRFADDPNRSLVGQLVPDTEPDLPWDVDTPVAHGLRAVTLICRLSEPAPGLIAWLTVRHHDASTGLHWTSGVFLRHPNPIYRSEALLRTRLDGQLTLQVRAPSPDLFFNVLRDSIEHLARTRWPGLTLKLHVPCRTAACDGQFDLMALLEFREQGDRTLRCQCCRRQQDIATLVTGFEAPTAATLQADLQQLAEKIDEARHEVGQERAHAAQMANLLRSLLVAVGTEVTDCPRLFTIFAVPVPKIRRPVVKERYRIILWCEHPDHWHSVPDAQYEVEESHQWLVTVAPWAMTVVAALKIAVPIAGAVAGVALSEPQVKATANDITLMQTLIEKLPTTIEGHHPDLPVEHHQARPLAPAKGAALRALRATLLKHDPAQKYGGLCRRMAPSGELLWVCPDHDAAYDPGLPTLPANGPSGWELPE